MWFIFGKLRWDLLRGQPQLILNEICGKLAVDGVINPSL